MRRETTQTLFEPWMKKLHIAPLALDADLLDLSAKFRTRLYESLSQNGWLQDQSLVIAANEDDPRIEGQVIQGRHRVMSISQILKDGHRFDISKILIRRVEVKSIDELRALRASYEVTASLSKDPVMSRKWVRHNLDPIIKGRMQEGQTKILHYLRGLGFNNDSVANELIESELSKLDKKARKRQATAISRIPESVKGSWGNADAGPEVPDDATVFLRSLSFTCEHCKKKNTVEINVAVGDNRELVRLAPARKISL